MTHVSVNGLYKSYGTQPVLTNVDLRVADGTLTAVLGTSGSGKTTLLRVLAGFERADRGTVELGGRTVDDGLIHMAPERRKIGYVSQEGALFPHLTVRGNVGFGLKRHERRDGRIERLIEMVGLEGLGKRYPNELSGGQQQRVSLARALATEPAVVLLDEPFAALDVTLRVSLRTEVKRVLSETGTTAILVTHDQDEALSMADKVAVLRDGVIVQHGEPRDLYERPTDARLAGFVGDANLIAATVDGLGARCAFGTLSLRAEAFSDHGAEVVALVRPEQIRVLTNGDVRDGVLTGKVVSCEYFGHDTLLGVETDKPCGPRTVMVRTGHEGQLAVGTPVALAVTGAVTTWPAADVVAPVAGAA